jgi:hypothetical protein
MLRCSLQLPKIFLLGGETFNITHGSGGYKNDVYSTTGTKWLTYESTTRTNKNEDPEPRTFSQSEWLQVTPGRVPPLFVSYRYWISCEAEHPPWKDKPPQNCDVYWKAPAQYKPDIMWSPRRFHAAISFKNELMVFGGRAREIEDMREGSTIGGLYTEALYTDPSLPGDDKQRVVDAPETTKARQSVVWHERTVLKNDVWSSRDGGVTWDLLNPGCFAHQGSVIRKGGSEQDQCYTSDDCYGDAQCVNQVPLHFDWA